MGFTINLWQSAKKSLLRFPVVSLWATFGSIFLISIYASNDWTFIRSFESLNMILALGVSWLIACQFLSETLKHNALSRFVFKGIVLVALGVFYIYLKTLGDDLPEQAYDRFVLLLLAGHLFVVFAPFVFLWDKSLFWNYLKSIFIAILRSGIYAIVLYIGLALAISALEFLFDVEFNDNIYLQTFIFCLGIVNTFVYLHDFPKVNDLEKSIDFNKAVEVLMLYILIPLSLLYLLIVYAYALKIIIDWQLPRGWVTYLISGLSILAFVIHIAIEPVRQKHDSKIIQKFFPYYFYAILPLLPLLFIALYQRITDYNFTELRYLGMVLAVWIAGMLIYMLVSSKKPLSLYAKTLFLLILLCTFGPLSAYKISMNAQLGELEELMQNLKTKTEKSFTAEEFERFSSIIRYIDQRHNLSQTQAYFGFNPDKAFSELTTFLMPKKIADTLQINIEKTDLRKDNPMRFYNLNFKRDFAEEISNYNHFTLLKLERQSDENKALQLYLDDDNTISLRYYGEVLFETNMSSHLKAMAEKYDLLDKASQDEFTFRFKNDNGDFLVIFQNLNMEYLNENVRIKNANVMLFYRTYDMLELP